jgi:hypothetical protein
MKINLSIADREKLGGLFSVFDRNMEKAESYNQILEKKTPVQESRSPLLIHEIDPKPYLEDDYHQKVKPEAFQSKGWSLFYDHYAPQEGFVYDELAIDPIPMKRRPASASSRATSLSSRWPKTGGPG